MSYSFELLPDEPILIATISPSFDQKNELIPYLSESKAILDSVEQPVFFITDSSDVKVKVFQDFMVAFNRVFREYKETINHPNFIATIFVSTDKVITLGVKGLNSATFGYLSVPVFDTLEKALAHVRQRISQG